VIVKFRAGNSEGSTLFEPAPLAPEWLDGLYSYSMTTIIEIYSYYTIITTKSKET
jgi:hypothetical protein